jgi:hypothetical protein
LSDDKIALEAMYYFPSAIYEAHLPQFLDSVKLVADETIEKNKSNIELDELYPVFMSENIYADSRIFEFSKTIAQLGWDILSSQGYAMENLEVNYGEMWMQEHHKTSGMVQHIHGNGCQLVGFYFLETPENSSKLVFHDSRAGKNQINLPQKNVDEVTLASEMINFSPKSGFLYISNSWIPHSFTKHGNEKPLKFIHINLYTKNIPVCNNKPEII